jgi:transposase-like protein
MPITQTITLRCPDCQSDQLKRNGHVKDGRQRYKCLKCGKQHRENPRQHGHSQETKDIIIKASQERSSLRGLQRTFGVERHTISKWIKKKQINSQS